MFVSGTILAKHLSATRFIFLDVEPGKYIIMKNKVKSHVEQLSHCIKSFLGSGAASRVGSLSSKANIGLTSDHPGVDRYIFGTLFDGAKKKSGHSTLARSFH